MLFSYLNPKEGILGVLAPFSVILVGKVRYELMKAEKGALCNSIVDDPISAYRQRNEHLLETGPKCIVHVYARLDSLYPTDLNGFRDSEIKVRVDLGMLIYKRVTCGGGLETNSFEG